MKAVVIGGGIIGLSSAYFLVQDGWDVTIVDQSDLHDSCSYGNLGMIVPSHFVPLAAPGIVAQGIRWMFNSKSPFYVKPSLNLSLMDWGLKFIKSATEENVSKAGKPLTEINLLSKQLYEQLTAQPGFDFSFEKKGIMMYFKSDKVAEEEIHMAATAKTMGLDVQVLSTKEAQDLEPEIELDVLGAVHYKCDAHLYPNKLNQQLIQFLQSKNVKFELGTPISSVITNQNKITSVVVGDQEIKADTFVFAAGSWMSSLLKLANVKLPLMPGKGYSFTHEHPAKKMQIPSILCEARVAITPMGQHLRFGGTMEIGAINNTININRVRGIVESVPAYMPGLSIQMPDKNNIWYGFRPCSPDGLPYIGKASKYENVLIAGGHAMMGLSLGPATGRLIAELASNNETSIDLSAFNPSRFN